MKTKELVAFIGCTFVLTLVFGFDDGSKAFIFENWARNFFLVFLMAGFSLFVHEAVHKYFAYRHNCTSEFRIWHAKRFGFKRWENLDNTGTGKALRGLPLGIILAFVFTILSNGLLYFTAIFDNEVSITRSARTGRKHIDLNQYEDAIIQLSGILANIGLMVIAIAAGEIFKLDIGMFVNINFFMALFSMLPFSSLEGAKIFFGSRNLYVFGLLLIILAFILKGTGVIGAVVLSIVLAMLLTGAYYFLMEN